MDVEIQPFVIAGTGHRPNKLGGYDDKTSALLLAFAENMLKTIGASKVISGMALGWDQALAEAAINLQIPCIAAVPFEGQEQVWPQRSKDRYKELLAGVSEIVVVSEGGYATWKMYKRNEWMVQNCDQLLALWDGSPGGTAGCVGYADKVGKDVINCWGQWVFWNQKDS